MGFLDWSRDKMISWLFPELRPGRDAQKVELARAYRTGAQRPQIKIKPMQADDNVIINLCGLIADRSVSALFGKGFEINYPGEGDESALGVYLETQLDANNQEVLFHRLGLYGVEGGTCYIKFVPDADYIRLIAIDPAWVTLETDPEDFERVTVYVIAYKVGTGDGEIARKQIIKINPDTGGWIIQDWQADMNSHGKFYLVRQVDWQFDFAPILYWQNLPSNEVYGQADLTPDVIQLQDRINFLASNINRIIRYHAHPMRYMTGGANADKLTLGPDEILRLGTGDTLQQLEMQSDLAGSLRFLELLRQSIMDTTRTVDISSMTDRVGALTNFGLRVLWRDALSKIETKRELYGDAIIEMLRRLLIIGGINETTATAYVSGISIVWPDVLDADEREQVAALKTDVELGILSKQTAAQLRGYDWQVETERLKEEAAASDNVGAAILRAFRQGQ